MYVRYITSGVALAADLSEAVETGTRRVVRAETSESLERTPDTSSFPPRYSPSVLAVCPSQKVPRRG